MYARVTTTLLSPEEVDVSADVFERVLPAIRELDGFSGMLVLSEMEGRRVVAVSLWDSAEALDAADPIIDRLRQAETSARRVDAQETARFRVSGRARNAKGEAW
jgi:hypothetical protein